MTSSNAYQIQGTPAKVIQIGGTTIRIFRPEPVSEAVQKHQHEELVNAVAGCLKKARKNNTP